MEADAHHLPYLAGGSRVVTEKEGEVEGEAHHLPYLAGGSRWWRVGWEAEREAHHLPYEAGGGRVVTGGRGGGRRGPPLAIFGRKEQGG